MGVTTGRQGSVSGNTPNDQADVLEFQKDAALRAREICHAFGPARALDGVSLTVRRGEIHALLGPNGAGKTTLIRSLVGLLVPDQGEITILGRSTREASRRDLSKVIGLADSGDRNFYLRISGLENLAFYGRLHGMSRRDAVGRAREALDAVGLSDVARKRVMTYSHGMQKRLAVARAILHAPPVLLIDEATHDLDPIATRLVHELISSKAQEGVAILWATQRVDEIRGFADRVTLLHQAEVRFSGTIPELMAQSQATRYLLHLATNGPGDAERHATAAVGALGTITHTNAEQGDHFLLALNSNVVLGDVLRRLLDSGIILVSCTHERSSVEEAFLHLTKQTP